VKLHDIPIEKIEPNPFQKRVIFDKEALSRLTQSIRKEGLLQPIAVRKIGKRFQIIHGERRFRAFKRLCKPTIPAIIRELDDKGMLIQGIAENLSREDLYPIEKASALYSLFCSITPKLKSVDDVIMLIDRVRGWERRDDIAKPSSRNKYTTKDDVFLCSDYISMVGFSPNSIIEYISILKLPEQIQKKIEFSKNRSRVEWKENITTRQAYQLSRVPEVDVQLQLFRLIKSRGWSLKRLTAIVNHYLETLVDRKDNEEFKKYLFKRIKNRDYGIEDVSTQTFHFAQYLNNFRIACYPKILVYNDFKPSLEELRTSTLRLKQTVERQLNNIEEMKSEQNYQKGKILERELGWDARFSLPSEIYRAWGIRGLRNKKKELRPKKRYKVVFKILDIKEI